MYRSETMYESGTSVEIMVIGLMFIIIAYAIMLIFISDYANRLGRTFGFGYVLLGIFFSPFIAFLCLYMVGETSWHRELRIIEEEKWRLSCHGEPTKENHAPVGKEGEDILNVLKV